MRYHDRLWRELDEADMHFSVVKYISNASKEYLEELNQSPGFWGLTMNAHMYSTLMHLNNLFGKEAKEKYLHMRSFLDFVKENLAIFSREAFEKRLRAANRNYELAAEFDLQITCEKVEQDIAKLSILPIPSLKAWRNRILSHINKNDVAQNTPIEKKYLVKTRHIAEIIDTLDKMLNDYRLAFDFLGTSRGLAIESGIKYILDAIRSDLQIRKKPNKI
ncbi:hypothetical protein ACFLWO_01755 [Chloroflexota bacterium]